MELSIFVMPSGKIKRVIAEHPSNAPLPMLVITAGKSICFNAMQLQNATEPMIFTVSGKRTGQCYSFCGQWQEANACFARALEHFDSAPADRQRTLSYYLHALIEQPGAREQYEKYAAEYFGVSGYEQQFKALAGILDSTSRRFAIYVYIKALFVLYRKQASVDFLREVLAWLDSSACAAPAERKQHPWEIIYKYCAFLALFCKDEKTAAAYRKKARKSLDDNEALLLHIVENGEQELARLKAGGNCFSDEDRFTYMYR